MFLLADHAARTTFTAALLLLLLLLLLVLVLALVRALVLALVSGLYRRGQTFTTDRAQPSFAHGNDGETVSSATHMTWVQLVTAYVTHICKYVHMYIFQRYIYMSNVFAYFLNIHMYICLYVHMFIFT